MVFSQQKASGKKEKMAKAQYWNVTSGHSRPVDTKSADQHLINEA